MGDNPAGKLLRSVEGVAYWAAVAPVLARLPAAPGYRIACWRGDLLFWCRAGKRTELARNVRLVLGNELSPAAAQQVVRDWFRLLSCETVDVKRLRRRARPLRRLVEIRGQEHLEAALAAGKGATLCSARFDQRHLRDGSGHHRRRSMEAVRMDDVKQPSVAPQRAGEPRRDRKLPGATPVGKPAYRVFMQSRKRGATWSLCVDHYLVAVLAQLVAQVSDNHFDPTELWREPRGDERDPHWNVRWLGVPIRLAHPIRVEMLVYPAGCWVATSRSDNRNGHVCSCLAQ